MSTANYDSLLIGWAKQNVQANVEFSGGYSKYSKLSEEARKKLSSDFGWNISDSGLDVSAKLNVNSKPKLRIYPTLFNNEIYIAKPESVKHLMFSDLQGRLLLEQINLIDKRISTSGLLNGIYVVSIEMKNGDRLSKKLIKNGR